MRFLALEPVIEAHHPRGGRAQPLKARGDAAPEESRLDDLFDVRRVRQHPFPELAVAVRADGGVESHGRRAQPFGQLHGCRREACLLCELLVGRLAVETLPQFGAHADHACEFIRPVERQTHAAPLRRQGGEDGLPNPPHGVADELHALIGIEPAGGGDEPDVPLLHEVEQAEPLVSVSAGHGDDEAQVRADEALERGLVAASGRAGRLPLLGGTQQRIATQLL